jgi:hypothetical protein
MPGPNALQLPDCPAGVARDALYPLNTQGINQYGQAASNNEGIKPTYRASVTGYAPYATAQDIIMLANPGASTITMRVTRINVCGKSTAASLQDIRLLKRSALNTGGTPTSLTVGPLDSTDVAGQGIATSYAAAPTSTGLVGEIDTFQLINALLASGGSAWPFEWAWGAYRGTKSVVLHPGECICLNCNGATIAGGLALGVSFEWTEETPLPGKSA